MDDGGQLQRLRLFRDAIETLRDSGIENPALDAAVLLGHVTGETSAEVLLKPGSEVGPEQAARFRRLISGRCRRVAVSRLVGRREFYSRSFRISRHVLDPRPETEVLVDEALEVLKGAGKDPKVLDVGTGSGAIAVTIAAERPAVSVTATDISMEALVLARTNAAEHGVGERVRFVRTDLAAGIGGREGYHLIVSNPPYVPRAQIETLPAEVREGDPRVALEAGPEGTEFYPELARLALRLLKPGGTLMVEVGEGQDSTVSELFGRTGLVDTRTVRDLSGTGRVVAGSTKRA